MSYPFRVGALGVGTVVRWKSTKRRISEKAEPNEIKSTRSDENTFRKLEQSEPASKQQGEKREIRRLNPKQSIEQI